MTSDTTDAPVVWQVQLLGNLQVRARAGATPLRPASRAAGLLLARLALAPGRAHPRESLVDMLWPGVTLQVGRNRLREALCTLNRFLGADSGAPVLQADRSCIRVLPGRLVSDVALFERALQRGDSTVARALYGGELLPGHYDEWVLCERQRLEDLHEKAMRASVSAPMAALLTLPELLLKAGHAEAAALAQAVVHGVAHGVAHGMASDNARRAGP